MNGLDRRELLAGGLALPLAASAHLFGQTQEKKDPYADGILKDGEPPMPGKESFCVAVLPDTQHYSEKFPATYTAQTNWIAEQQNARNIQFVLHLGDITNRSTVKEWENASASMKVLDDAKIPYAYCPGNHDYSDKGVCKDRTTLLNDYFPVDRARQQATFGGVYDREPKRTENNYHRYQINGRKLLVLSLEFGPRNDVLRWANEILGKHADHEVILITHAHIYYDDTRYDWKKYGEKQKWNPHAYTVAKTTKDDVNDGEEVWAKLLSKHENVILTLNGHVLEDGLGLVKTRTPAGREIPQILVNFQMRPHGGDGWLRLLEFKPDRTVSAIDYSPVLKKRNESKQNHFAVSVAKVG